MSILYKLFQYLKSVYEKDEVKETVVIMDKPEETVTEVPSSPEKTKKKAGKKEKRKAYTNRELSWLQFDERCLNEAGNPSVPLAERLTFASIFQTNLDEFFMVRVGSLMDQRKAEPDLKENKTGMTADEQIDAILDRVKELEKKKGRIYEQLMGELEPQGIRLINFRKLSAEEASLLEKYFDKNIMPYLSPTVLSKGQPVPFMNNKDIYAAVELNPGDKTRMGIVPCSNSVFKRLIEIPSRPGTYMLSEELILHFASKIFKRYVIGSKTLMRITRNADIDTNDAFDEEMDYRDAMAMLLKQRKRLAPVRIEITRDLDKSMRQDLAKILKISASHIVHVETPLDLKFVFQLQDILHDKTDLFYEKRSSRNTNQLDMRAPLIPQIEKKDVLLSYPYHDMRIFIKFLQEAARDDSVVSIKMTLYRVAEQSKVIEALIDAAENGKEVDVLVELRARFDEENNIDMSRRLEEAGCRIIYGINGFKCHSKLCLITRNKDGEASYLTQIGTGNYNEKTSKLYTDLSLITSDQRIGEEALMVFNALLKGEFVEETGHLMVAPHCLQNKICDQIDREIEKAKNGVPAYVGIKVNSLTDKVLIKKLIEASNAGVRIEMVVRGICCLKPGVPGYTENITIISIVGRFLEHSRIYIFGTEDDDRIFISSADFMTRNTVRRVEIAAPVYDPDLKKMVRHIFDTCMQDDEKGKIQTAEGLYIDRDLNHPEGKLNSQEFFYQEAYEQETK